MFEASAAAFSEAVLDSVPQIVWTAQPDGTCTYLNRRWYEVTGLEPCAHSPPESVRPRLDPAAPRPAGVGTGGINRGGGER